MKRKKVITERVSDHAFQTRVVEVEEDERLSRVGHRELTAIVEKVFPEVETMAALIGKRNVVSRVLLDQETNLDAATVATIRAAFDEVMPR